MKLPLPLPAKILLSVGSVVDGAARVAALQDITHREEEELLGKKEHWQLALALGNSLGAIPLAYFTVGRADGTLHPVVKSFLQESRKGYTPYVFNSKGEDLTK